MSAVRLLFFPLPRCTAIRCLMSCVRTLPLYSCCSLFPISSAAANGLSIPAAPNAASLVPPDYLPFHAWCARDAISFPSGQHLSAAVAWLAQAAVWQSEGCAAGRWRQPSATCACTPNTHVPCITEKCVCGRCQDSEFPQEGVGSALCNFGSRDNMPLSSLLNNCSTRDRSNS
jgi:hypothetical protein